MRLSPEVPADVSVPYRCLYAKKIKNLFLGGRHISTSHVAFAAVRVMRTLGMLGEVVGMAAAVCIKNNGFPRDVYTDYFDELKALMINGVKHHPGGHCSKTYHFKDIGHIRISPNRDETKVAENLERIQEVNKRNEIEMIDPLNQR